MGIEGASASQVKAIESLPPIKAIAAGHMHSLAVEEAGGVWGFGASTFGETGLGVDLDPGVPPMRIDINVPMVAASAGKSHSMLLSGSFSNLSTFSFFFSM
jgi:alpha-tubulin suppressor-like RCC1 family protein